MKCIIKGIIVVQQSRGESGPGSEASCLDPLIKSQTEGIKLDVYVPPDERLSPKKLSEIISNSIQATLHFLIPEAKSLFENDARSFESFDEIRDLFSSSRNQVLEGWVAEKVKSMVPPELYKKITHASKQNPMEFQLPQIIAENEFAWKDDVEFGRQMLAGTNPAVIQILEAMDQWRIFILDHHDYLMPFLNRICTKGVCAYASRTLLFLRDDDTLKPLAIELSWPGPSTSVEDHRVFLPSTQGTKAALWQLAKAHVAVNDSCHHQLISHW
ncbi:PLAT/LH2 domain-containing lipoxygenase family protein [Actinidia rufa]|uniref:PLAT/LH2 domain-containing lipoxygenase family protein n=1 Tax=Actinidia rufa TaxID=165716 RepID=A0A7J0HAC2_9ERIC|nr:PLAT/LH2 domain-containing lipoxygenase family protein [Actinidia rufa]